MAIKNLDAKEAKIPSITVRERGKIGRTLERLGLLFEANNPGEKVRWVYDPQHKPQHSNILERQLDGYRIVEGKELSDDGIISQHFKEESQVRVGDLVLMAISNQGKLDRMKELVNRAHEQRRMVERSYYDEIQKMETRGSGGKVHRASPQGKVSIQTAEADLNHDQGTVQEE